MTSRQIGRLVRLHERAERRAREYERLSEEPDAKSKAVRHLRKVELQEIGKLHEKMYEQILLFHALKTRPDCEVELAETRQRIIRIYSRIQALT